MLQYPINVYPDKVAFDASKSSYDRAIHFTFKGDLLTCAYWRVYNYDTQQVVAYGVTKDGVLNPLAYNNDNVDSGSLAGLSNGRYILQMMFTQTERDLVAQGNTYYNIYDRYVSRGKVQSDYTANSATITIEDKINLIYEWNRNGNVCEPTIETVGSGGSTQSIDTSSIQIEINGVRRPITAYNYELGEAAIGLNGFTTNIAAGTEYKLYANYLITEQYYFEVASEPTIKALSTDNGADIWVTWDAFGGTFAGFYWQGQSVGTQRGTMLKYYTIQLQKKRTTDVYDDIYVTGKIYSQNINWHFVDDYDASGLNGGNYESLAYKIILTCVMQNGMSFVKEYTFTSSPRVDTTIISNFQYSFSNTENAIILDWGDPSLGYQVGYRVYRLNADGLRNNNTNQDKRNISYANYPQKQLIGYINSGSGFTDYFPSNDGSYRYMIVPFKNVASATDIFTPYVTEKIAHDFDGYTITAVKDTGKDTANLKVYHKGDTWKIICDIQDTDNVQNFNKQLHVGNGKYSTVTSVDNDYMSGSLSGYIGYMNCSTKKFEDDIETVKAWRRFLAQDCQFVLRSPKGDVWLVNIMDNANTKYEEKSPFPVQFSFSWAECGSMDDILIYSGNTMPPNCVDRR